MEHVVQKKERKKEKKEMYGVVVCLKPGNFCILIFFDHRIIKL